MGVISHGEPVPTVQFSAHLTDLFFHLIRTTPGLIVSLVMSGSRSSIISYLSLNSSSNRELLLLQDKLDDVSEGRVLVSDSPELSAMLCLATL